MIKAKPTKTCCFDGCKNSRRKSQGSFSRFCNIHVFKATINGFLGRAYENMKARVNGTSGHNRGGWVGKSIVSREVFYVWAKNNPDFLTLYKQWFSSDFDRRLTPSVNRMNSEKGYTLNNMEWLTNSQNCGLAGGVKAAKQKKEIYNLLGVNQ